MNITLINETKRKVDKKLLNNIAAVFGKRDFQFSGKAKVILILKTKLGIVSINKEVFGRKYATDVISVNYVNPELLNRKNQVCLGDIYICPEVIEKNAKSFGSTYKEEFARVIIHGMLHLAGFDHKKPFGQSREKMFLIQEKLVCEVLE
ncbi:MAG: rRNA maturation RNase YbeY [Candidatus Dojkabacteria bacterium]|nr:rRNA maturation RNase YbeY [Candidatus Dojkabacteria bacterium]